MIAVVAYNPPLSTAVVNVPEALADRYDAAGWTRVEKPKQTRQRRASDDGDKK